MTEDEVRDLIGSLDGVRVVVAGEENGAPQSAWGDSFFYFDPDDTGDQHMMFATIVVHDYEDWDEVSNLDRPGAFRVNLAVGRANVPPVEDKIDYSQEDVLLPHPQYAVQGWVAIVNPGPAMAGRLSELVRLAHARAVERKH